MADPSIQIAHLVEAGWKLVSETCPSCTTPLVSGGLLCVTCKGAVAIQKEKGEVQIAERARAQPAAPEAPEAHTELDSEWKKTEEMMNQTSSSMADKLLSGWAMLDAMCPRQTCMAPLLRDPRTRKRHCITCGGFYPPEGDLELNDADTLIDTETKDERKAVNNGKYESLPEYVEEPEKEKEKEAPQPFSRVPNTRSNVGVGVNANIVTIMTKKMNEASIELDSCKGNWLAASALVDFIEKCARTIKEVEGL